MRNGFGARHDWLQMLAKCGVCSFLCQTFLSNRVFEVYGAILDAACHAWNAVRDTPWRIMSIGLREWARTSQL